MSPPTTEPSENPSAAADKPWGGRFTAPTDAFVEEFTASVGFDQRLALCDIEGSIAHARMLSECGVLSTAEFADIERGLGLVRADIEAGRFQWSVKLEDVHMNVERALVGHVGEVGKKLHTARSRNDQVATDIRLYLRGQIDALKDNLGRLLAALIVLAEREADTLMPGYTHLQAAQPVSFGHHMLAWFEMLLRDADRLNDCRRRVNVLPLGAGALAGTTFPIDRHRTAELLGFDAVAENSLDAVSDRDFAIEFAAVAALVMVHYSRMAEELVLWNSQAFGFVDLDDAFCTGSSMMPQKKNPDVPELVRGKSGRVVGHLVALITLMKGQPLAYNKDNQEDKEPVFDLIDTLAACTRAFAELVPTLQVRRERLRAAAAQGFIAATDLADHLVRMGRPFRDAHAVVGGAVALAVERGCELHELSLEDYRRFDAGLDESIYDVLDMDRVLKARNHFGGTAPAQVRAACVRARERIKRVLG
ncbi:MAG: argininosuccinate lyase [Gammaproteobacteria bacterium]|nr:argininosuccinate lyase [Gammaproteobacteria bacterium]